MNQMMNVRVTSPERIRDVLNVYVDTGSAFDQACVLSNAFPEHRVTIESAARVWVVLAGGALIRTFAWPETYLVPKAEDESYQDYRDWCIMVQNASDAVKKHAQLINQSGR